MAIKSNLKRNHTHSFQRKGFSYERLIRYFFASNAGLTIVILLLIIIFLIKEGLGFFPGYKRELETYRIAGLEFVDISRKNLTSHEQLTSLLNRAYYAEINGKSASELKRSTEASAIYNAFTDKVGSTRDLIISNASDETNSKAGLLAALKSNYEKQRDLALDDLPSSPHLSDDERNQIIESLKTRPADNIDDPALVTKLAGEYAEAQIKHSEPLLSLREAIDKFEATSSDLSENVIEMTESVTVTKELLQKSDILERDHSSLLAAASSKKDPVERQRLLDDANAALAEKPDIETPMQILMERKPSCINIHEKLKSNATIAFENIPDSFTESESKLLFGTARKAWPIYISDLESTPAKIQAWSHTTPVPLTDAILSFITGKEWVTGGEWQDFYGILPLAIGSLLIAIVALTIAIPVSISAAIYVNQFANKREQSIIKPIIEFIQAIPSVVIGFIGILVFGTLLREFSQLEWLQWIPGFPIEERLNIFTAGCLMALMTIPTIFSLAEDALNNVPSVYAEASEALGASRIQTTFRVMIPAAFSGILAAVLLGLGRVIGETMVVLLVAGNRIKIPDFSEGLGTFFQPAHTLTGIIAQELGEVPLGSVHYRALFVVGVLLFFIALVINALAHRFLNKVKK